MRFGRNNFFHMIYVHKAKSHRCEIECWLVIDADDGPKIELPVVLTEEQARIVGSFLIPQLNSLFRDGMTAGAREEREKIAYGLSFLRDNIFPSSEQK